MTTDERDKALAALREPFPPEVVGKLPKGGVMLDFVGHATTTDRLLTVDPEWNWEPMALDEHGLPQYDAKGGLWIKLTICGLTRLGYGDGPDPKQRIGDALRNAAMRFGVALDLWSKTELESSLTNHADAEPTEPKARSVRKPPAVAAVKIEEAPAFPPFEDLPAPTNADRGQLNNMHRLFGRLGITDRDERLAYSVKVIGHALASSTDLTHGEADALIAHLEVDAGEKPPLRDEQSA